IRDRLAAVEEHRDALRAREGDRVLLGEAPRDRLDGKALVGERELRPPAIGAEAQVRVGTREVVEPHRHGATARPRRPTPRSGRTGFSSPRRSWSLRY